MRRFATLFAELDASTATSAKLDALLRYYAGAPAADAAWATYFLAGGRPRQAVPTALLRATACAAAGIDDWLFEECYQAAGDLAEAISLVLPPPARWSDAPLAEWVEQRLLPLRALPPDEQALRLRTMWGELDTAGRFLLGKLIGGGFRVGVSRLLVQRALSSHAALDVKRVAERMMGYVDAAKRPDAERFAALIAPHDEAVVMPRDAGQPYPFFLAHQIDRQAEHFDAALAYDVLEWDGIDRRGEPQHARRARLEQGVAHAPALLWSPRVEGSTWVALASLREQSRERGVEGLMLKAVDAAYGTGRIKASGVWWKWKIDPMRVDAVLIYAQAGHGRRASVYTDYTFAVWNRAPRDAAEADEVVEAIAARRAATADALQLVPFAKAYSGLTDDEFKRIDRVIRATTTSKFGPVRSVRPSLVFELGFEGINRSTRHKSGIAVRFPRMLRIRDDKPLHEADTLRTWRH